MAVYHVWLGRVSGGVDVFFVVTGFFITAMLLRDAEAGRVRPLRFLARLVRRLWPAAALVLLTSLALVHLFVGEAAQRRNFAEIGAAATYWENWYLATRAVDYLDAEDPPTIAQHFWALSLQGQFYLLWLAVFAVVVLVCRGRRHRTRRVASVAIATLGTASFAWSVWLTATDQPLAYFVTPTRIWEFCAGAVLALLGRRALLRGTPAAVASSVGLVALVLCGLVLPVGSSFPGWAALWPVTAAALLVVATTRDERPWAGTRVLATAPLVWLGARSYGIYLWHWPFLVVARETAGTRTVGPVAGTVVILGAVGAAVATHALVERRVASLGAERSRRAVTTGLVLAMAVTVVGTAGGVQRQDERSRAAELEARELSERLGECFGANALRTGSEVCAEVLAGEPVVPERSALPGDVADVYDCFTFADDSQITSCSFGREDAGVRIALVGSSHAATIAPLLRTRLDELDWRLDTFTSNGCVWGNREAGAQPDCEDRITQQRDTIVQGAYDVVLYHGGRVGRVDNPIPVTAPIEAWDEIATSGTTVIVIEDNPRIGDEGRDCIAAASDDELLAGTCDTPRAAALAVEDRYVAAAELSGIDVVSTVDLFCDDSLCPATIGNVVVYRDAHHLTASYVTTAGQIVERTAEVVGDVARQRD